jgi:hypothetical protein
MELKKFIEETLMQIVDGVSSAQKKCAENGAVVNPSYRDNTNDATIKHNGLVRMATNVQFEVLLIQNEGSENNIGIGVFIGGFGIGGKSKADKSKYLGTPLKFNIPIALPCIETTSAKIPLNLDGLYASAY